MSDDVVQFTERATTGYVLCSDRHSPICHFASFHNVIAEHVNAYFVPKNGLLEPWSKCRIDSVTRYNSYLVTFCDDVNKEIHEYPQYQIAPNVSPTRQLMNGTRVIAAQESPVNSKGYFAGVVGETVNRSNDYKYLIFFDNGHVRYVSASVVRVVEGNDRWLHAHENAVKFMRYYFEEGEPPMISDSIGATVNVEHAGKWCRARIDSIQGDLLIHLVYDGIERNEWMYRGSPRLERIHPNYQNRSHFGRINRAETNENVNCNENSSNTVPLPATTNAPVPPKTALAVRGMRSVIRCRRVRPDMQQGYLPPKRVKKHTCGPCCCSWDDISKKNEKSLSKFGPLTKPMIMGWTRLSKSSVSYVAPCGKSIPNHEELRTYLNVIGCRTFDVDNFCFDSQVDCLREFSASRPSILSQVRPRIR